MTIANVGSAVELNEQPPSSASRTLTMPTVLDGDGAFLFLSGASGGVTYTVTDNGMSVPFTAVAATQTNAGMTSQVFKVAGLSASDTGKIITIATTIGVTPQVMKVSGGIRVIRGAHPTELVDAYDVKITDVGTTTPSSKAITTVHADCGQLHFISMSRGGVQPNVLSLTVNGSQGVADDFGAYTGVTASLSAAAVAYSYTPLSAGASIGAKTFTADQEAPYSAWTISVRPPDAETSESDVSAFNSAFTIAPSFTI